MTGSVASTLSDEVLSHLRQALDYTQQLDTALQQATADLNMPREMTGGLEAQRQQLDSLVTAFAENFHGSSDAEAIDRWLFPRVCDAWSLHAQNDGFAPLCARLFRTLSSEAATRLEHLNGRVCVAHISCVPRVEKAQASIESFAGYRGDLEHLIVVGTAQGEEGGFCFQFTDGVLSLHCGDHYEAHCRKCLLTYTVLALVANPRLVYKFDDDVTLDSGDRFDRHLTDLLGHEVAYAGHLLTGFPNHRKFWHGWHLGKCSDQKLEAIGYQAPIASAYAEGGFAYALGPRSLAELAYAFFTHQAFLEINTILYEDATVGLLLQIAGIALTPVAPFSTGLSSERHRLQQVLEIGGRKLLDRQNASAQRLRQHPIHDQGGSGTGLAKLLGGDLSSGGAGVPPSFEARVAADLGAALAGCRAEQERLADFVPRRIHLCSRRLARYFDPELFRSLEGTMRHLLEPRLGSEALSRIERITVGPEIGPARPDTLYVVCLHLMDGELEEIERVRSTTNSVVVGWCWDNHHNYRLNARLAEALDVCVPAHHQGRGFLKQANRRTTSPLPLCCAQWSLATLTSLLADHPLTESGSTAISGRFSEWFNSNSEWDVGTRRRDLVRTYGEGAISEHVQVVLERNENYSYFTLSAQERLADWRRHRFSLCLPVRADLSLRFFDAIAAGQLPIVDRELAGAVLDDLAPSLISGRDYLLVDVDSPADLLEARQWALDTWDIHQRQTSSQRVLKHHLLEHRLALLAETCLLALAEGSAPQPLPTARPVDECLGLLRAGADDAAVAQLAAVLQQGRLREAVFELLAGLDRRLQIKADPRPSDEQRAAMGWAGVALVDQARAELPPATLPDWLPVLEERFCRLGALALQPLASAGGPSGRQARQRAITLLLRLGALHQPCPAWVLQAARSLLQSDCDDDQSPPQVSRDRTELLHQWRQQLEALGVLDGELERKLERALAAAADRLAISVVIPFWGHSEELAPALAALEAQTMADFELVVVADGCPFDGAALARLRSRGLAAQVVRLDENRGPFWARAAGAAAARGQYLWFLDHDDSVGPRFLERMLERARATAADVVECPLWVVPANSPPHSFQRFAGACVREGSAILQSYLAGGSHNNLANKLIRRSLWQAAMEQLNAMGLQADQRLTCFEDLLCTVVLYQVAERYASTIEIDYEYLERDSSTTNNRDPAVVRANLASMESVLRLLRPLLLDHGDADGLAAFQAREVDWSLEHLLLGRVQRSLTAAGWERVERIQRMLGLELSGVRP